ncbi:glycoside hydrolase [Meredithblackwellia eburnea MCA 4105]
MDDGTEFVYENEFGGTFDSSPSGANARAQSYSPSMSERWDFASDKIFGVNLGGWLNVEPFITPYLFEPFENDTHPAIDEWSLSVKLGDRLEPVLRSHYETFVTEKDFAEIAGAGLNWVRIPLPYWAIEVEQDEPFLPNVSWEYFLKAVRWARKYGLRINLDLHTAPGSQNGWNHSGKFGNVGFMNGPMGLVNAQRTLNHIRALSEFLKTPENSQVVMMFGIMNEPLAAFMGDESLMTFYYEAYKTIRSITGLGEGHGPMISIHDSFERTRNWLQFLHGADRLSLDNHRYIAFRDPNTDPISELALMPCEKWGYQTNQTLAEFGFVSAGEFSVAVNDCGRYLNGVGMGFRFDGTFPTKEDPTMPGAGTCRDWDDYRMWDKKKRRDLLAVALNHMDSTRNWFYWTWKTSDSLVTKLTVNPLWSYSLGRREGWIPRDPRNALGSCESYTAAMGAEAPRLVEWDGTLQPWQTGGEGAGDIDIEQDDKYGTFPPLKLKNKMVVADLPRYTPTGIPKVLKGVDPKSVQKGGWYVPVKGCEYLGSWTDLDTPLPTKTCPL